MLFITTRCVHHGHYFKPNTSPCRTVKFQRTACNSIAELNSALVGWTDSSREPTKSSINYNHTEGPIQFSWDAGTRVAEQKRKGRVGKERTCKDSIVSVTKERLRCVQLVYGLAAIKAPQNGSSLMWNRQSRKEKEKGLRVLAVNVVGMGEESQGRPKS